MNEQKQIEAMAKADGWTKGGSPTVWRKGDDLLWTHQLPAYLTDANQIERLVEGLDRDTKWKMVNELAKILFYVFSGRANSEVAMYFLCATTAQKVEAYLRAVGEWTKEMEG